ncbi:calcium-binding protein [Ensifer soli]|uniref:calcium-binding protein n=1 Tax=Ciceribacter sp. sgz301302 TaxID=3342379 RepID=UPI0035B8166A
MPENAKRFFFGRSDDDVVFRQSDFSAGNTADFITRAGNDLVNLYTIVPGNDQLAARVFAGAGNDRVIGTPGADIILGDADRALALDSIKARGGRSSGYDDEIEGGPGDDTIFGMEGNDVILGGDGDDRLAGDGARGPHKGYRESEYTNVLSFITNSSAVSVTIDNGRAYSQTGNDRFRGFQIFQGSQFDDRFSGAAAVLNYIDAENGNDTITGGASGNILFGGGGQDALFAGDGKDYIDGGDDNDEILGAGLGDEVYGGNGDDFIGVFRSITAASGGNGNDRFSYMSGASSPAYAALPDGTKVPSARVSGDDGDDAFQFFTFSSDVPFGHVYDVHFDGGSGQDVVTLSEDRSMYVFSIIGEETFIHFIDPATGVASGLGLGMKGVEFLEFPNEKIALDKNGHPNIPDPRDASARHAGTGSHDILRGYGGNDILDGRIGNDLLIGGLGDDTYIIDSDGDRVDEVSDSGDGNDTVRSTVSFSLSPTGPFVTGDVENLILASAANLDGTGNGLSNRMVGGAGDNRLVGGDGADVLYGRQGNDILIGGDGADQMWGGRGRDLFVFRSASDSGPAVSDKDRIDDFQRADRDRIVLSSIDADTLKAGNQAFAFIGWKAFSGKPGELRFTMTEADTTILADVNGDRQADLSIHLDLPVTMVKNDFLL